MTTKITYIALDDDCNTYQYFLQFLFNEIGHIWRRDPHNQQGLTGAKAHLCGESDANLATGCVCVCENLQLVYSVISSRVLWPVRTRTVADHFKEIALSNAFVPLF
jgi:hypothetical protein